MSHYARISINKGVDYAIGKYVITTEYTSVDEKTASYLRKQSDKFDVITKNQYNKLMGNDDDDDKTGDDDGKEENEE